MKDMKRTTVWLGEQDKQAIKKIRAVYGTNSDSAAIRLALRILATYGVKISDQGVQNGA